MISYETNAKILNGIEFAFYFAIGFILTAIVEGVFFMLISEAFNRTFYPRGAMYAILPIAVGVAFGSERKVLRQYIKHLSHRALKEIQKFIKFIFATQKEKRFALVLVIGWLIAIPLYTWLFEPYGYMSRADENHFITVLFITPIVCLFAYAGFKWASQDNVSNKKGK